MIFLLKIFTILGLIIFMIIYSLVVFIMDKFPILWFLVFIYIYFFVKILVDLFFYKYEKNHNLHK